MMKIIIVSQKGKGKICNDALLIRKRVFIKEQHIDKKIELDNLDINSIHFVGYTEKWHPVTTIRLYNSSIGTWHISRVATLKKYRHKGFASEILKKIERDAKEKNVKKLELESQYKAANLYRKIGFQKIGKLFKEANIDHIKMYKFV